MRERLGSNIAPEVQDTLFGPALKDDLDHYYSAMNLINKAHLLMLSKQGIIEMDVGKKLASELVRMETLSESDLNLSAAREDLYYNIEAYLVSRLGVEVAGQLHTGRSRNDLYATASRIKVRDTYFEVCSSLLNLLNCVLQLARSEVSTVAPGYTHMQPAEPITLGHYFAGIAESMERDYSRLEDAYPRINLCPLGAGAMAGTSFPLDRQFVAECLGFDGIVENTLDAVASRDYLPELLADFAILMTTVGRLAQDLDIWATDEFRVIEVSDSIAASSSIMPQKKNPITFEHIRAKAGHVYGALVSALSILKGVPFGHCRDVSSESFRMFWVAASEVRSAIELMRASLTTMSINRQLLAERSQRNFCTVTELANNLVRRVGMSFREAHGIVGRVVYALAVEGLDATAITPDLLAKEMQTSGIAFEREFLPGIVSASLDPAANVAAKKTVGGPAPEAVTSTATSLERKAREHEYRLASRSRSVSGALTKLNNSVRALSGEH